MEVPVPYIGYLLAIPDFQLSNYPRACAVVSSIIVIVEESIDVLTGGTYSRLDCKKIKVLLDRHACYSFHSLHPLSQHSWQWYLPWQYIRGQEYISPCSRVSLVKLNLRVSFVFSILSFNLVVSCEFALPVAMP